MKLKLLKILLITSSILLSQNLLAAEQLPKIDTSNKEQMQVEAQSMKNGLNNTVDGYPTSASYLDYSKPLHITSRNYWIQSNWKLLRMRATKHKSHQELIASKDTDYALAIKKANIDYDNATKRVARINKARKITTSTSFEKSVKETIRKDTKTIRDLRGAYEKHHKNFQTNHHISGVFHNLSNELFDVYNELGNMVYIMRSRDGVSGDDLKTMEDMRSEISTVTHKAMKDWTTLRNHHRNTLSSTNPSEYNIKEGYRDGRHFEKSAARAINAIKQVSTYEKYRKYTQLDARDVAIINKIHREAAQIEKEFKVKMKKYEVAEQKEIDRFLSEK